MVPHKVRRNARLLFILSTALGFIVVLPFLVLAVLNPFWFRESFLNLLLSLAEDYNDWRCAKIEAYIRGYSLEISN